MNKPELRAEERVRVSCRGTLRAGEASAPCMIQNMCSRGFLIKASKELPVGRVLQLTCELYPGKTIECTVQVRHVNADCLGARVTEISDEAQAACMQFLRAQRGGT